MWAIMRVNEVKPDEAVDARELVLAPGLLERSGCAP